MYYHVYFIPIFPYDKNVNIICGNCGLKRYGLSFDQNLFSHYEEIKRKYRHPFYTYTGAAILILILVGTILSVLLS